MTYTGKASIKVRSAAAGILVVCGLLLCEFIYETKGTFAETMKVNFAASAGVACAQGFDYLGTLQPHALENFKNLTISERDKILAWNARHETSTGGVGNYSEKISMQYDIYEQDITRLSATFNWCTEANFISFRDLFEEKHEVDLYVDNIHYTEAGNKKIASAFVPFVLNSLKNKGN